MMAGKKGQPKNYVRLINKLSFRDRRLQLSYGTIKTRFFTVATYSKIHFGYDYSRRHSCTSVSSQREFTSGVRQ